MKVCILYNQPLKEKNLKNPKPSTLTSWLANYSPKAKSGLPIFVNRVLLEHSHTH